MYCACQFGKARKKSHREDISNITASDTVPGQGISANQLEAGFPGRIPTTRGLPAPKRYKFVNLWVDHYSRYIYPTFHATKKLKELLASKREFELFAQRHGVALASIRADNGVYASTIFHADCKEKGKNLSFCAVGGHWQNGVVEHAICVTMQTPQTILLHAMSQGTVNEEFWTFAVRHACTFHNASIHLDTGQSPHHMFMGLVAPWKLEDSHVFKSTAFVLDKHLQDGDSLHKWKAHSWLGVYIRPSLVHAGNVPVIYNPLTTHVSPQFHVVHDNQFTSVLCSSSTLSDEFYQQLYEEAKWLDTPVLASSADNIYTFDAYWSTPPLSKQKSKICSKYKKNIASHDISELNMNAATKKLNRMNEHQIESQTSRRISNAATTMEPVKMFERLREYQDTAEPVKYNSVHVHTCSTELEKWKTDHRVTAAIQQLVDPSDTFPELPESLSPDSNPSLNPLSYAHIAQTGTQVNVPRGCTF